MFLSSNPSQPYFILIFLNSGRSFWLADHLDEAAGQLRAELAARQEVDTEQEAMWTSAAWVRDLVLDNADGPSSQVTSLSTAVELLEGRINATTAIGVR
jgi:hypothetical protein